MKKTYSAPKSVAIQVVAEGPLALSAGSSLSGNGGINSGVRPGEDTFEGEFSSNKQAGAPTTGARKNKTP